MNQTTNEPYSIPLERILTNPWQAREEPDLEHIEALADDIHEHGLLQAPIGRIVDEQGKQIPLEKLLAEGLPAGLADLNAFVQLAFGHSRLAAFRRLSEQYVDGWLDIPVQLRDLTDIDMALLVWNENDKRKDLTPIEKARQIQKMCDSFHWTQDQVAEKLKINRATVANRLRLLRLPAEIQAAIASGKVSERQAMAVLPVVDLPDATRERAERNPLYKPSLLMAALLKGDSSSDQLRAQAEMVISACTISLAGVPFVDFALAGDEIATATCHDCQHNKNTRCQLWDCYDRKVTLWQAMKAESEAAEEEPEEQEEEPEEREEAPAPPPPAPAPIPSPVAAARPAPVQPARPAPAPQPAPAAELQPEPEPLSWEKSTLTVTLTYWPDDHNPAGRMVAVGLRANTGAPVMRMAREDQLLPLPKIVTDLLVDLKNSFGGAK